MIQLLRPYMEEEAIRKLGLTSMSKAISAKLTIAEKQKLEQSKFGYELRYERKIKLVHVIRYVLERFTLQTLPHYLKEAPVWGRESVSFSVRVSPELKQTVRRWSIQLNCDQITIVRAACLAILEKEGRGESAFRDYIESLSRADSGCSDRK